jgi:hypothetical protein
VARGSEGVPGGSEGAVMPCAHSNRSDSGPCSQCAGAIARVVSIDATTIDGQPSGRVSDPTCSSRSYYARRGGIAKGRRTHS